MQYIKFIIAGCVLAVALCGCGRQVKLLTSETQTETQMMDDAGGEETVVSSAEAFATTTTEAETPEQEQSDDVAVYVCGAVRQPGVYYVAGSAIRETAVQMAGGFTDDADVTYVNLAQTDLHSDDGGDKRDFLIRAGYGWNTGAGCTSRYKCGNGREDQHQYRRKRRTDDIAGNWREQSGCDYRISGSPGEISEHGGAYEYPWNQRGHI